LRPHHGLRFNAREPKQEVFGKTRSVALNLLVEAFGRDSVERGECAVEQHRASTSPSLREIGVFAQKLALVAGDLP
jgi:hypothetical protein